jgi:hypothetical protein
MKTYDEVLDKAKYLYYRSFKIWDSNIEVARSFQSRADCLLHFVLEMDDDQMEDVWKEAQDRYEKDQHIIDELKGE